MPASPRRRLLLLALYLSVSGGARLPLIDELREGRLGGHAADTGADQRHRGSREPPADPTPTYSGYVPISKHSKSALYYAYYEATSGAALDGGVPIVLWLQGGPGCASTFGSFYELGPFLVDGDGAGGVSANPHAWSGPFGLLLVDQPVGSGYSVAAREEDVPTDEMAMAHDLYKALQAVFTDHGQLRGRPLFIAGESYAGKYLPSIAHYILQAAGRLPPASKHLRQLPAGTDKPAFDLAGIAIGNGLVDPVTQTPQLTAAAATYGFLSPAIKAQLDQGVTRVLNLIAAGSWQQAHDAREALRADIQRLGGIATLLDVRRGSDYDPGKAVDRYLNLSSTKALMGAAPDVSYASCSPLVSRVMGADTMKSVKYLVPDLLDAPLPVLLYQGMYDGLDGVASSNAWIDTLDWDHRPAFTAANGSLWYYQEEGKGADGSRSGGGCETGGDCEAAPHRSTAEPRLEVLVVSATTAAAAGAASASAVSSSRVRGGSSVPARPEPAARSSISSGSGAAGTAGAAAGTAAAETAATAGGSSGRTTENASQNLLLGGWMREHRCLRQVVIYNAGHMAPRDQGAASLWMLRDWVAASLSARRAT